MVEEHTAEITSRERIRLLVEGKLPYDEVKKMIKLLLKDQDRFWKYLEVLQARVLWKDQILLRISEHLYIVQKEGGPRVVKCDCGQEFGDYRANWKLGCRIRVRTTPEELAEIFVTARRLNPGELVEIREFYCPGCLAQLAVEVVPPGYPIQFEFLPDLDRFYRQWLERPLPDEPPGGLEDRTSDQTAQWAREA
ncbi:MAG: acetone carboxylase subunit gamma [Candidatus Tectomicrobia bacterium]|uniref:Acetone carboxylase subunit gamma n=1 Tax=Tectimicrobiota bacterium TaxID=2528274 RepID=A0A932CNY2_UNCTE|nr:acetone carboxylase subunit gamma [Candidatus Tectomicrobia bacterium]